MTVKTNKVQYKMQKSGTRLKMVSKILLTGNWLSDLGFSYQDEIQISAENGKITIRKV